MNVTYQPLRDSEGRVTGLVARARDMTDQALAEEQLKTRFITAKGQALWTRSIGKPVLKDGEVVKLTGEFQDITARKQAEIALQQTKEDLEQAVRFANVGLWDWDFITNKVRYSAEWKRQIGYADDEIGDALEEWQSRVHPDDLEKALAHIHQTINTVIAAFRQQAVIKGLALKSGLAPNLSAWVFGDAARLRQVLFNLLGNAIKFTERGEVRLDTRVLPGKDQARTKSPVPDAVPAPSTSPVPRR